MSDFADIIRDLPGRTKLVSYNIVTNDERPIRLPPYRISHAWKGAVKEEIDEMLEEGIIEPSNSDWSFPIVLVKKRDGSLRLCVDYRLSTVHPRWTHIQCLGLMISLTN